MITFTYNNKQYTTNHLDNKLNKLGITKDDIVVCKKDYGDKEVISRTYYYSDGPNFTGVFKSTTSPPEFSTYPWCLGWRLHEGTPDISRFSNSL